MAYCLLILLILLLLLLYYTHIIYLEFGTQPSEIVGHCFSASAVSNGSDAYTHIRVRYIVLTCLAELRVYDVIILFYARQTLTIIIIYNIVYPISYLFHRNTILSGQCLFYTYIY